MYLSAFITHTSFTNFCYIRYIQYTTTAKDDLGLVGEVASFKKNSRGLIRRSLRSLFLPDNLLRPEEKISNHELNTAF